MFLLQYTDHISLSHNFEKILFSLTSKWYQNRLASDIFNRQITKISILANIFFKIILHQCIEKMW